MITKYVLFLVLSIFIVGCADRDIANDMLEEYFDKYNVCVSTYGSFPFNIDQAALSQYGPLLDEFEKHGYVDSEEDTIDRNYAPKGDPILVDVRRYKLTEKGKELNIRGHRICFGKYEVVSMSVDSIPPLDGVNRMVVDFEYQLVVKDDWAEEMEELVYLSDDLYDAFSTQDTPGIGQAILQQRKNGKWGRKKVLLGKYKPSLDPKDPRNLEIIKRKDEASYRSILVSEKNGTSPNKLLIEYGSYLNTFRSGKYKEEISSKHRVLLDAANEKARLAKIAERKKIHDTVAAFSKYIDDRDNDAITSITADGTVARRVLSNNVFTRNKVGTLAVKSYKLSGSNNENVQVQLEGIIYMLRARLEGNEWLVVDYATRGGV